MKFGDIIQFRPTGIIGRLIAFFDGSEYSHTAIYLEKKYGVHLFIESHEEKRGVVITKLQEWRNFDIFRPKDLLPRPRREVYNLLGRGYDYGRLVAILKSKLSQGKTYNNDDVKLICSELADYVYKYRLGKGEVLTPKKVNDLYTQGELEKIEVML
jgi:hypothetical protein